MSVSLTRTLRLKMYPIGKSAFFAVADIMLKEYRKRTIPKDKAILSDDIDEDFLRDFIENSNPPITRSFSVLSDGFQQHVPSCDFNSYLSEDFAYERCAAILGIDTENSLLYFSAHLDGVLELHLTNCFSLSDEEANQMLRILARQITKELKNRRKKTNKVKADNQKHEDGRCDRPQINPHLSTLFKIVKWIFDKLVDLALGHFFHLYILSCVLTPDFLAWIKALT